jgi:hypothetical protein
MLKHTVFNSGVRVVQLVRRVATLLLRFREAFGGTCAMIADSALLYHRSPCTAYDNI